MFASLIVLSYNRVNMLVRSVTSLIEHTHYPYQLIIMDDASDALTQEYIFSLVQHSKCSTAVFNVGHNQGLGIQMNRAMAIAQGGYIFKLDADLEYTEGWLARAVRVLQNLDVGCMGLFKYFHDPCDFRKNMLLRTDTHYVVHDFVGSAIGFRRDMWSRYGPWDLSYSEAFAEDVAFKQRMQADGFDLVLPLHDLVTNFGFGADTSSLIKSVDPATGDFEYNVPHITPKVFNLGDT